MLHIIFILSLVLCLTDAGAKTQKVDKGGFRNPVVKLESKLEDMEAAEESKNWQVKMWMVNRDLVLPRQVSYWFIWFKGLLISRFL